MVEEVSRLFFIPASRSSISRPIFAVTDSFFSPSATIMRFSPTIGMTSATVPSATRSAYRSSMESVSPSSAQISLNATPTPARLENG